MAGWWDKLMFGPNAADSIYIYLYEYNVVKLTTDAYKPSPQNSTK
jgi:hypothetical protein